MAESVSITTTPPDFQSMQYDLLRAEGLKHIQALAGKIWTDYNLSDPGVSILEVLSYVITDLGYRTSYSIPDILAQDPSLPNVDIKNFYTAREILPMNPVTYNDYRKLMIDCDVHDPNDVGAEFAGVKNAWIEIANTNEIPVYINRSLDKLDYVPEVPSSPEQLDIRVLYNILLELDTTEKYGDLNEDTLEGEITLSAPMAYKDFAGIKIKVNVEFPRWDDPAVDWNDRNSIQAHIKRLTLTFSRTPEGYTFDDYGFFPDKTVWVSISQLPSLPPVSPLFIETQINDLIYSIVNPNALLTLYQLKVKKILKIIAAVRKRLMANRNLGEDVLKINAVKAEEIAVCADIEIATDANVEETLAKIYFEIGNFLAPTVYFYTIEEMYAKGKRTEEIFEGPPLNHGFIDDDELEKANRRKVIHVSDLIHIIMEIPGVIAVKSIQIANVPEDNTDNIPSVSVRWCLDLAFDFNYVPRLSTDLSNITFFKDLLPYQANGDEVDALLKQMQEAARPQKIENAVLDLPVPQGEFKNIEQYVSTQDEFPLTYGIGPDGLPDSSTDLRKAQAKQLKAYLMFFDQLLADYLSQLAHVKDLFSMNGERDAFGHFIIDKSYFTQSLIPSVTDANDLLVNATLYPKHVQDITEDEALFEERRNKFLDHLMARFSEQFSDYAMIVYKLTGKKAPKELLEDKLELLNAYPEISAGRFKAFNYESPCELWHVDNESGLERRASLLTGIDPRTASDLHFHSNFAMTGSTPTLGFSITNSASLVVLTNATNTYTTVDDWKLGMEKVILNGVNREKYIIYDAFNMVVGPDNPPVMGNSPYTFQLVCDEGSVLGLNPFGSPMPPYPPYPPYGPYPYDTNPGEDPLNFVNMAIDACISTLADEFYFNAESNRDNLWCPLRNYIDAVVVNPPNMVPDPPTYTINFTLYKYPFNFTPATALVTGTYTGKGQSKIPEAIISVDTVNNKAVISGDFTGKINIGDTIVIDESLNNNGTYTVAAVQIVPVIGGFETHITLTGPALSNTVPLGTLLYNPQSAAELFAAANASVDETLFEIMFNGTFKARYTFDFATSAYRFNIADRCGDTLATSVEFDFNAALAALAANHPGYSLLMPALSPTSIRIINNSTANDGDHVVMSTTDDGPNVVVTVSSMSMAPIPGGNMIFDGSFNVLSVDTIARKFVISGSYNRVFFPGETIRIIFSQDNDGSYTIDTVTLNGGNTEITVIEDIFDNVIPLGSVYYVKTMPIINIIGLGGGLFEIHAKAGADDVAVDEMVAFINTKFFGHEGLHLVEHVLLRPKVNDDVFVAMGGTDVLTTGLSPQGDLTFTKKYTVVSVNVPFKTFVIAQDITPDLSPLMYISLKGSTAGVNDGTYRVVSFSYSMPNTSIVVFEEIPDNLPGNGTIYYSKTLPINTTPTAFTVKVTAPTDVDIDSSSPAIIANSQNGTNDGTYLIKLTAASGGVVTFTFNEVLRHFQDALLPINLRDECASCVTEDPYSFIASVVMPYWQGRFINQDFRNFFERTLQLECPAHLALNICWVDCGQMQEFELKYKIWQVENAKQVKDKAALSTALNALIDILNRLRSVYPPGTLHDCTADDATEANPIILNRTALGTIQI